MTITTSQPADQGNTQLSYQEQAQQIWDQLGDEEASGSTPQPTTQRNDRQESESPAFTPAENRESGAPADVQQTAASPEMQALLDRLAGYETMFQQQNAAVQQMEQRLRKSEGRIGELNMQLRQQLQVASDVSARGGNAPTAAQITEARKSPEAMSRLKDDYPEFATAMEAVLDERLSNIEQRLQSQIPPNAGAEQADPQQKPVTREELEQLRMENEQRAIDAQISAVHKGWRQTIVQPEFKGWMKRQPIEVQLLADSNNPSAAIRLLDIYQEQRSSGAQRNQRLTSAAALPSGRQAGIGRQKPVEELQGKELWDYLDAKERAEASS